MRRNKKYADDLGLEVPVEESTIESHEGETVLGPDEYVLVAPLVVRGREHAAGDRVTLTPRQAEFARGQNCIQ